MTPDELRERVARAMLATPLDGHYPPVPWEDASDEARDAYLMEAAAAIAVCMDEVVRLIAASTWLDDDHSVRDTLTADIRAMIPHD